MAAVVKMIVVKGPKVIFGDRPYKSDYHANVAERAGIPEDIILGGGIADLSTKKIFGTSYGFGPYDPDTVSALLPGWIVEPPSSY